MKPRYIYALIDPRYGDVRYIGASTEPWSRAYLPYVDKRPWQSHVAQATNGGKTHKDYWIRGLTVDGFSPTLVILEWGTWTIEECATREIWWISFYLGIGAKLLNKSGGGEQTPMWRMSDRTRALIAERTREAMRDPAVREKVRRAGLGRTPWNKSTGKAPYRPPAQTHEEQKARKERGRRLNRIDTTARWAAMTPEQRAERGRRISETKLKNRKTDQERCDDGVRMAVGRRLAKAGRSGWTLPIVSKVNEPIARLNQK